MGTPFSAAGLAGAPPDVLKLAMEKEKSSYAFYSEMIKNTDNPLLIKLLEDLKKSEWGHIQIIKRRLER